MDDELPELPPRWEFTPMSRYYFVDLYGKMLVSAFCVDEIDDTGVYRIESGILDKCNYSEQFEDFTGYASMQEALDAVATLLWCRHQEFEQQVEGFMP